MPALNDLDAYCQAISVPAPILARTRALLDFHKAALGRAPDQILLENTISNEGAEQFTNLACLVGNAYVDLPIPEPNWKVSMVRIGVVSSFEFAAERCS